MPLITLQTMLMLLGTPMMQPRNLFDMYLRQTPLRMAHPLVTQPLMFEDTGLTRPLGPTPLGLTQDPTLWQQYPQAVRNMVMLKALREQGVLEQQVYDDPYAAPLTLPVDHTNYPNPVAGPAAMDLPLKTPLEQVLTETIRQNVWNLMYPGLNKTVTGLQTQTETDPPEENEALNMTVAKNGEEPLVGALDMEA